MQFHVLSHKKHRDNCLLVQYHHFPFEKPLFDKDRISTHPFVTLEDCVPRLYSVLMTSVDHKC